MSDSPGWDAIDAALKALYPKQEPKHLGTVIKWALGGNDPLDGTSIYQRDDHWHYVSYGLTELYDKETDTPDVSGFGFELTFRLARSAGETEPPVWPVNFMQNLARYVFNSGNAFAAGHSLSANGPIADGQKTDMQALSFVVDSELGEQKSANGKFKFLQIVGLSEDELEAAQAWNAEAFVKLLAEQSPLLITSLARKSICAAKADRIREGTERDGSSMGSAYFTVARWTPRQIVIDAKGAGTLIRQLSGRLAHGRNLIVVGTGGQAENVIVFKPAQASARSVAPDGELVIELKPADAEALRARLKPQRGTYALLPGLEIEVVPQEIKDATGKVVQVIG